MPTATSSTMMNLNPSTFLNLFVTQLKNQDPTAPMDPSQMTTVLAQLTQVQSLITGSYLPGTSQLPPNFFSVTLPTGFATTSATAFDIRTLNGLKLYRLRQAYSTAGFGNFSANNGSTEPQRYIQFSLKLYF